MMKKVLVIGSNGFVGNQLCKHLHSLDSEVIGAFHINKENLFKEIEHYPISDALKMTGFDTVFIASAYIPRKEGPINRDLLYKSNVLLVTEVCTTYPDARIVLCSSVAVYGSSETILSENSALSPTTEYGVSKLWGEKIAAKHGSYAIVRFSSIYGK